MAGSTNVLRAKPIVEAMDQQLGERVSDFRQAHEGVQPELAIVTDNYQYRPTRQYIEYKTLAAARLGIKTLTMVVPTIHGGLVETIERRNNDFRTHGTIVQLPLQQPPLTDAVVSRIRPEKDVDGLGPDARFFSATATAIPKLLEGNGVDWRHSRYALLGTGRLVGGPLKELLLMAGVTDVKALDKLSSEADIRQGLNEADVIISSTGHPGILTPDWFDTADPKVVVDAGAAEQNGVIMCDMSVEMREFARKHEWLVTPEHGGVGPLPYLAM